MLLPRLGVPNGNDTPKLSRFVARELDCAVMREKLAESLGRLVAAIDALLRIKGACCVALEIAAPDGIKLN